MREATTGQSSYRKRFGLFVLSSVTTPRSTPRIM